MKQINLHFFIRAYHVKEGVKTILDKEMKRLYYLGILKEGSPEYLSPGMLISRKVTKDKRVVTDFRHLNVRKAKITQYMLCSRIHFQY